MMLPKGPDILLLRLLLIVSIILPGQANYATS